MSTLIERMILRTRQPLSSLEPITPVRYAPTTPVQQPDEAAFTEIQPTLAEVPRQSLPPPPHGSGRHSALGDNRPEAGGRDRRAALERTDSVQDREHPGDSQPMPAAHDEGPDSRETTTAGPTAPALPTPVPARLTTADLAEPSGTASPPSVPEPAAATAGSVDGTQGYEPPRGPDITVTIGHIEVRAAPSAAARPAPPPFRPQVSLTDFLNGTRGSQR